MPTRACGQLSEPDHHAGDADHGHEGLGGFVVTRGDATEVFDLVDKAFDEMALLVEVGIVRDGLGAGTVRGDHGVDVVRAQVRSEGIGVEGLVGNQDFGGQAADECFGLGDVVRLAGGETNAQRIAERIDGDVQLGAQPPARAPDGLILSPPFAPAECWWARTMVESSMTYSKSGSSAKALKRLSHTPAFDQRQKRFQTLFQLPTSSGRSRHGAPVRATHSTASTNRRLSRPVTPRSDSLPGTRPLIRSHCASDRIVRIKTASFPKTVLNHTDAHLGIPFIVHRP